MQCDQRDCGLTPVIAAHRDAATATATHVDIAATAAHGDSAPAASTHVEVATTGDSGIVFDYGTTTEDFRPDLLNDAVDNGLGVNARRNVIILGKRPGKANRAQHGDTQCQAGYRRKPSPQPTVAVASMSTIYDHRSLLPLEVERLNLFRRIRPQFVCHAPTDRAP
jgi:hypothetical protein